MAGVISYGAHMPLWRLTRDGIAEAWGSGSIGGERGVVNNDEDTVYHRFSVGSPQAALVAVLAKELGYP